MSIQVTELSKAYGEQRAVDAISFELKKGEITGFLGPNGAGKSTTMKMITGFLPPTSGTATVCGFDVVSQSLEVRKRVGYLPESNPLYYDMYLTEFLGFVAGIHKMGKQAAKRIDEVIGLTGLQPEKTKKIGALSNGYKQRVGIAQALLHDPEVLILDEPTTGLDPNQLADIRQLIKTLGASKTVILSTHIMQEVEAICDRAIIINQGKIIADDRLAALQQHSGNNGYLLVSFAEPISATELEKIGGVNNIIKKDEQHWQLFSSQVDELRKNLLQIALINNWNILSLQSNSQSLESIFRDLTKRM